MAILSILAEPDPRLRQKSLSVDIFDTTLVKQVEDMIETLRSLSGYGLAAPQVDILKRVIVYNAPRLKEDGPFPEQLKLAETDFLAMVNPQIINASEAQEESPEACFSLPDLTVPVKRPTSVWVKFYDAHGKMYEIKAEGIFARCIQHEIDHLEGVLTIDYMSPLKKEIALRRLEKIKRYR